MFRIRQRPRGLTPCRGLLAAVAASTFAVWSLGAAALHAQVTTGPQSRAASRKLLVVDLRGVPARVTTDAGLQSARLDGQIAFRQVTGAAGDQLSAARGMRPAGRWS